MLRVITGNRFICTCRFKPTSIRVANKDAKSKVDKGRRGKKVETSKVEIQTVCPASR